MKIQWLRNVAGKFIGLAVTRKGIVLEDANHKLREFVERPKAICDCCELAPAVVFCFGHVQYVCAGCLAMHNELVRCNYASVRGFGKFTQQLVKAFGF